MYSAARFSSDVPLPRPLNCSDARYVTFSRSSSARMESMPAAVGLCASVVKRRQETTETRNAVSVSRCLKDCCTMHTVSDSRVLHPVQHFFGSIGGLDNIQVFDANHLFPQQLVADPIEQSFPVIFSDENNRKW